MPETLLVVDKIFKKLCRKPEHSLRYSYLDVGREILGRKPRASLRVDEFWALQDVSLSLSRGEILGIIGHNGAGKSTLLQIVSGIIKPTSGTIVNQGRRIAFIDANGGLNPRETGRENAHTQLSLYGYSSNEIKAEMREIERFAEIGEFIDAPVSTFSLGMRLRLASSIYTRLNPDIFVIDEALGGGDIRFRNRFNGYLSQFVNHGGAAILCTHELVMAQLLCPRCVLLEHGRVHAAGETAEVISSYHELSNPASRIQQAVDTASTESVSISRAADAPQLDHRISVAAVRVKNIDGSSVIPGSSIDIEIDLNVSEVVEGIACAIEIGQGEMIAIATVVGGYPDFAFTLQPPCCTLLCRIGHLPLAPGRYEARIGISIPRLAQTVALVGYQDNPPIIDVKPEKDLYNLVATNRQNLVHIDSDWHLQSAVHALDNTLD